LILILPKLKKGETNLEITLKDLLDWMMKSIVFILIVSILFGAGFFVFTKYFVSPTYSASIKFYASGNESNYQYLNYYKSVAPQYIEVLNVREFYEMVSAELFESTGEMLSPTQISESISFSSIIEETTSFFLHVKAGSAELAYNIALAVVKTAPERIQSFENVGTLEVLSNPFMPTAPSGPSVLKNSLIGLLLGFCLSVAAVVAKELLDTRIKSEEEIAQLFQYPILGVVPDFTLGNKKGE